MMTHSKDPVAGRNDRLSGRSNKGGHNLGTKDPRGTVPSRTVEASPKVEERDGGNTSRAQFRGRVVGRVSDGDVGTDVVHRDGSTGGTNDQEGLSSEPVYEVEQPDDGTSELDQTKDTGSEECSVRSSDTDGFENGGRVVV